MTERRFLRLADAVAPVVVEPRTPRRRPLLLSLRRDPLFAISLVVLVILGVAAVFPGLLSDYSPTQMSRDLVQAPSMAHPMGTDQYGRDILSRILHGAGLSLSVGFFTVLLALLVGVPIGATAGMLYPRLADGIMMRIMDVIMAFPPVVLAIAVVALLGTDPIQVLGIEVPHIVKLLSVIGVLYVPQIARITRGAVLVERNGLYVIAERGLGAGELRILIRDILPNCISPVIVYASLLVAEVILLEAALGFLGLGIQPPHPSWGAMLAEAKAYVFSGAWWMTVFPGLFIFLTVCAMNIVGDSLRDKLDVRLSSDPTVRG